MRSLAMRGGILVIAERWFASSKMCSNCGFKMEKILLSTRKWQCPNCQTEHDRDVNAARNLCDYALNKFQCRKLYGFSLWSGRLWLVIFLISETSR